MDDLPFLSHYLHITQNKTRLMLFWLHEDEKKYENCKFILKHIRI